MLNAYVSDAVAGPAIVPSQTWIIWRKDCLAGSSEHVMPWCYLTSESSLKRLNRWSTL